MWDLPGPGIEAVFPALAGGFLTTAPPGKSLIHSLLSVWAHGFLFYSMSYNPLLPLFILMLRLSQLCTVSAYSCFPYPVILSHIHHLMSTFLLPGTSRCSVLSLYFPCPSPGFCHFSKEPHFLSVGNRCTHSYADAKKNASRPF